jgi:glucose/arabinose dehydrogenase
MPRLTCSHVVRAALTAATATSLASCFAMRASHGGGQTTFSGSRRVEPADVAVPAGYRIEAVAVGLNFPTGVAFDAQGRPYVTESGYAYGEVWTTPRLVRVDAGGTLTPIATAKAGEGAPWNGLAYADGAFYVAAGGERDGGRILRIGTDGTITPIVSGLPSYGDHHTNGPVAGPDGALYFGQGTATNSGVVGLDNYDFGWLERRHDFHDIPCADVTLTGRNFTTRNPLTPAPDDEATTGAYVPFGTPTQAGQVVRGQIPCNGAVFRVPASGGELQLVAWGFRNPFGLAFAPDGTLYLTENSFDERGSRPVFGTGDVLYRVERGKWYGWPDYHAARALSDTQWYKSKGKPAPGFVLASHPGVPPAPIAVLGVHSSSNGLDFSRNAAFGHVGDAFIAQYGDMAPNVGKVLSPVGFKVVRVDVRTGVTEDFATNRGKTNGPASRLGTAGLERPVAARFDPAGTALYVVDFGVMTMGAKPQPVLGTGVLWRITRAGGSTP